MKQLFLIRGLPGSGKTTFARQIATVCIANDDYPGLYSSKGIDRSKMAASRSWCQEQCEKAMQAGLDRIAIHNTFVKNDYMLPYLKMAKRHGYCATVLTCEGNHGSAHDVPASVVNTMKRRWEVYRTPDLGEDVGKLSTQQLISIQKPYGPELPPIAPMSGNFDFSAREGAYNAWIKSGRKEKFAKYRCLCMVLLEPLNVVKLGVCNWPREFEVATRGQVRKLFPPVSGLSLTLLCSHCCTLDEANTQKEFFAKQLRPNRTGTTPKRNKALYWFAYSEKAKEIEQRIRSGSI